MNGELRPLGIGEILDAGIKLFLRHWRPLVLSVVGLILPVQILSALVTASVAPEQFDFTTTRVRRRGGRGGGVPRRPGHRSLLLSFISVLLATAVCFKAVADAYLGRRARLAPLAALRGAAARRAARRGDRSAGSSSRSGSIALIVPGIWLAVALSVAVPALLLERIGPMRGDAPLVPARARALVGDGGALLVGYLLIGIIGALVRA